MSRGGEYVPIRREDLDRLTELLASGHEHDQCVWSRGREHGREEVVRDLAAEAGAEKATQHGLLQALQAAVPEERWRVRGQQRTRETFGQPHPRDYPGRQREAEYEREAG